MPHLPEGWEDDEAQGHYHVPPATEKDDEAEGHYHVPPATEQDDDAEGHLSRY